ncbi:flagellum-specific ATP synthase FliI, partial [Staphylococcus sp. SIMBA_130]
MKEIVTPAHMKSAEEFKRLLAVYVSSEDLINIGAYKAGTNSNIDKAILIHPEIEKYITQGID